MTAAAGGRRRGARRAGEGACAAQGAVVKRLRPEQRKKAGHVTGRVRSAQLRKQARAPARLRAKGHVEAGGCACQQQQREQVQSDGCGGGETFLREPSPCSTPAALHASQRPAANHTPHSVSAASGTATRRRLMAQSARASKTESRTLAARTHSGSTTCALNGSRAASRALNAGRPEASVQAPPLRLANSARSAKGSTNRPKRFEAIAHSLQAQHTREGSAVQRAPDQGGAGRTTHQQSTPTLFSSHRLEDWNVPTTPQQLETTDHLECSTSLALSFSPAILSSFAYCSLSHVARERCACGSGL